MTISALTPRVQASDIAGKFICAPSPLYDQNHGYPAIVERVTAGYIMYRRLARGSWDDNEKEWRVNPDAECIAESEPIQKCRRSSVKYICDTAKEAIAMYTKSAATRKRIDEFSREQLELVEVMIAENKLPIPDYLN